MSDLEPIRFEKYQCKGGDTFDSIAFQLYDDEAMMTDLLNCNPQYINVVVFEGGEELFFPVYPDEEVDQPTSASAPWRTTS